MSESAAIVSKLYTEELERRVIAASAILQALIDAYKADPESYTGNILVYALEGVTNVLLDIVDTDKADSVSD